MLVVDTGVVNTLMHISAHLKINQFKYIKAKEADLKINLTHSSAGSLIIVDYYFHMLEQETLLDINIYT